MKAQGRKSLGFLALKLAETKWAEYTASLVHT